MQQPEPKTRNRIVIPRIPQIQKTQDLLVDEEEPKESVVFTGGTAERRGKIGRVSQGCQDVPRCRNQQYDEQPTNGMEPFPGPGGKQLASQRQVNQSRRYREQHSDQALQQETDAK